MNKMNKPIRVLLIILLIFLMPAAGVFAAEKQGDTVKVPPKSQEQRVIKHIIYITVGGLSDDGIRSAFTPSINGLAAGGVRTEAIGVLPANPAAFAASLLTGASPEVHGYVEKGRHIKTSPFPEIICRWGRGAVYISGPGAVPENLFGGKSGVKYHGFKENRNDAMVDQAIAILKSERPYFMGLELPGIETGLIEGGEKNKTAKAINGIDEQIGRFFAALRSLNIYEDSLIVVVGNYTSLQVNSPKLLEGGPGQMISPVIMAGPGLKKGAVLPPVRLTDIAPTTALLAGIQVAPESDGMVLWNALQSGSGFLEENLLLKRIKDLSSENINLTRQIHRLTEEKSLVRLEKEKVNREKMQIQEIITAKDNRIKSLEFRYRLLSLVEIMTIIGLGAGYVIEYFYLKKKFLMF